MNLASLFAAVDNENFPVVPLHWDGTVDVQGLTTWKADFKNVDSHGISLWAPPATLRKDKIPISARVNYHYSMADGSLSLPSGEISTPTGSIHMNGALATGDSAIDVVFDTQDLAPWDDFINVLRGADVEPKKITGRFHWQGRITGPLVGPTFTGHVVGNDASYERLYWDEIEGDLTYSPDVFKLVRASARRGRSSAQLEVSLAFNDWSFDPDSPWSFDATLVRTDTDGVQALLGTNYPVHGVLTGNFNGKGTRANPQLTGQFDVIDPQAWNWRFDRARGEISMHYGEVRISNAELRLLPPPVSNGAQPSSSPGLLTGNFSLSHHGPSDGFRSDRRRSPAGRHLLPSDVAPARWRPVELPIERPGPATCAQVTGLAAFGGLATRLRSARQLQRQARFRRLAAHAPNGLGYIHRGM